MVYMYIVYILYIHKYFKYRVENRKCVFPIFIDPADQKFIAFERIKGIPMRSRLCQNRGVVCARHQATIRTNRRTSKLFFSSLIRFFHLSLRPDTVLYTDRTHIEVRQIPSSHRTVSHSCFSFYSRRSLSSHWYALCLSTGPVAV